MNRTVGNRNENHPKPVKRIELFEGFPKSRFVLTIVLILIGVCALGYSVMSFLTVDTGWATIEAGSSEANCSNELIFQYYLGAGDKSATVEKKAVNILYTEAAEKAYQLFHTSQGFAGVNNLYYINQHPNEEIEVDEVLYEAFSMIKKHGNRAIYLAPVYAQYDNLFGCNDDAETINFDPCQNDEIVEYFAEIISFAENQDAIDIELLGGHKIKLVVSAAYLDYAAEIGFAEFVDFYWMKNAFIVDYIADTMKANGFVFGSISSYDGFVRNLDEASGLEYAFNIFDRDGKSVYQAGVMRYNHAMSIVYLRSYPANNSLDWQHYYVFRNGEIRTAYVDVADGYCKSAVDSLVSYSQNSSCAEVLLQVMPVYINDYFDAEKLMKLVPGGIYSIYCENNRILYNESSLVLTDLYDENGIQYTAEYIVD
ncbi:MAG: hypothetical protein K2K74_09030 [Lachnospiraceae bacterium]|nr:hypothetical protein [Lachnospiraceae bacterium]